MPSQVRVESYHGLYRRIQSFIGAQTPGQIFKPRTVAAKIVAGIGDVQQRNKSTRSSRVSAGRNADDGPWTVTLGLKLGGCSASGFLRRSHHLQIRLVLELVSQLATAHTGDFQARAPRAGGRGHIALEGGYS